MRQLEFGVQWLLQKAEFMNAMYLYQNKKFLLMQSLPATELRRHHASHPQEVLAPRFAVDVRDAPGSTQVRILLHCK